MSSMTRRACLATFLAAALGAHAIVHDAPAICCNKLIAATTSSKVLGFTSLQYGLENAKYWSSSCILTPQCIFTPTSSSDVSSAIKVLAQNKCQFAIRGGGHTPNPGWAGTSSGVLISLSKLTAIQVSEDATSVVVGAGNRWGDVYTATQQRGVTVAGGRISPVGVSGFLLGGGLSYLSHQTGFAANSVLSYEIVLADGTIANASPTSYSDLFKALKGGSGNFGIVTAFRLQTYPITNVLAGNLYYDPSRYDSLFPLMESYARQGTESEPKTHIISAFVNVPSQLLNMATFYAFHSDPVNTPPPAIQAFIDVPAIINTVKIKTVKDAAEELTVGTVNGLRYNLRDYSIRADAALYKELFELWQSTTGVINSTAGWLSAMAFQPISNSMIRASDQRGGNVLGLAPMPDPLIVVNYQFSWLLPSDDKIVYATIDKLMNASKALAQSRGKLADYIYLNYASTGQAVIESYGRPQVHFLKRVKAKYDPQAVFRNLSPGGFKVPA